MTLMPQPKFTGDHVGTTFNGNPSNSWEDMSLTTPNVNLMVALEEKSSSH